MYRQGAVGALLDIYEQTISDFVKVIEDIPDDALTIIVDPVTADENCKSIQTILTHVVYAGYGYATCIYNSKGNNVVRPAKVFRTTVKEYIEDLHKVFAYTEDIFKDIKDDQLEEYDNTKKMLTGWGQSYDREQVTEHAIVHILRHKRQVEKFKIKASG
ncbi:MAG TPA: DinB family protein [Agriterribacter sp.]|nr:DinB family protein [Agriterribacter sp.]